LADATWACYTPPVVAAESAAELTPVANLPCNDAMSLAYQAGISGQATDHSFTFEIELKCSSHNGFYFLSRSDGTSTNHMQFQCRELADGSCYWYVRVPGFTTQFLKYSGKSSLICDGTYHHHAAVYDSVASNFMWWMDGALVESDTGYVIAATADIGVTVANGCVGYRGAEQQTDQLFTGQMRNFKYYTAAYTPVAGVISPNSVAVAENRFQNEYFMVANFAPSDDRNCGCAVVGVNCLTDTEFQLDQNLYRAIDIPTFDCCPSGASSASASYSISQDVHFWSMGHIYSSNNLQGESCDTICAYGQPTRSTNYSYACVGGDWPAADEAAFAQGFNTMQGVHPNQFLNHY